MNYSSIQTLGELKKANYKSRNIKDELRENLIVNIKSIFVSFMRLAYFWKSKTEN